MFLCTEGDGLAAGSAGDADSYACVLADGGSDDDLPFELELAAKRGEEEGEATADKDVVGCTK